MTRNKAGTPDQLWIRPSVDTELRQHGETREMMSGISAARAGLGDARAALAAGDNVVSKAGKVSRLHNRVRHGG